MNTIPLIFNEKQVQYTVLSGTEDIPVVKTPLGVIILNNGSAGSYRIKILENLIKNGFSSIVSIERSAENYNLEELTQKFPCVKFLVPLEKVSIGDMINMGMKEIDTESVLVLNDSILISQNLFSNIILERVLAEKKLCVIPRLVNSQRQILPIRFSPVIEKSTFKVMSSSVISDKCPTLYPFDFIGIYNRNRFMHIGGFDYTITSPYWQNLDFFVRAWLWGEKIVISPMLQLAYDDNVPIMDSTPDKSQLRFFLKNCAPKFTNDHCYIPISKFFQYKKRSISSFSEAIKYFSDARKWVEINKYRFQKDITMLIQEWETSIL